MAQIGPEAWDAEFQSGQQEVIMEVIRLFLREYKPEVGKVLDLISEEYGDDVLTRYFVDKTKPGRSSRRIPRTL